MDRVFILVAGAALLAGQVSWFRLASVPLGGSVAAAMTTLSAAMAGLGLGSFLAGLLLRRCSPRALLAAIVPVCAAALALMPVLILRGGPTAGLLLLAHLPFGMILPCAGGRTPATTYALSALGGVAGALGFSQLLAPYAAYDRIGLVLAAALLAAGIPAVWTAGSAPLSTTSQPAPRSVLAVAALLGLLGLLVESLWLQLLGFYWESNAETFGLVTAASIGGVSLGSAYGRRLSPAAAAVTLALAAALSPVALQAFSVPERLLVALFLVGVPAACGGAVFARLLKEAPGSLPWLVGANAAGAAAAPLLLCLGATAVGWPARALVGVACGYGALASGKSRALVAVGLVAVALMPSAPPTAAFGATPTQDFEATVMPFARTGTESTVVVTRNTRSGVDILWIDRGFQGDTSALGRRIPAALGRVPVDLLGRPPRRALAIGLGTGVTLSALTAGSVEVAELSQGVIDANRTLLADVNGRVLERPGVTVHHGDGRTRLAEARDPYDLIVADMMFPTVAGAGNLFSREFYALVRRRLSDDGLFVHWLPGFLLAPEDLSSVAAAFLESFPDGSAWIGSIDAHRLVIGLAGGRVSGDRDRLLLDSAQLRRLAGSAPPLRDADPRLEIRSNRRGVDFGRENLLRLLGGSAISPGWRRCAEAGLAEDPDAALALYRKSDVGDAAFWADAILYERRLAQARQSAMDGDGDGALLQLRGAASNPHDGGANLQLGDLLAAAGRVDEAIAECEAAARKAPRSADASIRLAWLACEAGDRVKARRALDAALSLRPDVPPLYEELARKLDRTR